MDNKLAEDMADSARSAVEFTKTQFHTNLDYGIDSLTQLEQLFDRIPYTMPNPDSKETTGLLTRLWGSYLGEVIRKQHGGKWLLWNDEHGKAIARVVPPPVASFLLTSRRDAAGIVGQQRRTGVTTLQICDRPEPGAQRALTTRTSPDGQNKRSEAIKGGAAEKAGEFDRDEPGVGTPGLRASLLTGAPA